MNNIPPTELTSEEKTLGFKKCKIKPLFGLFYGDEDFTDAVILRISKTVRIFKMKEPPPLGNVTYVIQIHGIYKGENNPELSKPSWQSTDYLYYSPNEAIDKCQTGNIISEITPIPPEDDIAEKFKY